MTWLDQWMRGRHTRVRGGALVISGSLFGAIDLYLYRLGCGR